MNRKAIFLLYRVLQALASPLILVYLLVRGIREPRYFRTLGQRCGSLPQRWQQTVTESIWFHAVSVGEVLAARTLVEEVKRRSPRAPIFVSTTTLAGRETAEKVLAQQVDGIFFAPFDFVWAVRKVLRRLRPSVVVILETEIWPNFFREVTRIGCGLVLVNGRISDRALHRYRRLAPLFSQVLSLCDRIVAQTEQMREQFVMAGAPAECVVVGGNLKYDFTPASAAADSPAVRFIEGDRDRPLWIAASTSADDNFAEEPFVIDAHKRLTGWRLIVAPRKPERFDAVARLLGQSGLKWTRRGGVVDPDADVLLLDSIGELGGLFGYADAVFMGGTLVDRGGHNILEPAIFGKPVIVGPHMENFREIAEHFEKRRAFVRIESGEPLADAVLRAVADKGLGERARDAANARRGAAAFCANAVRELYESHYPCERPPQPAYAILWLLSLAWKSGSARDRRKKLERTRRLPVPVISVGNITAGGTGKTPVTIELLREFRSERAGLLTGGYGRATRENILLVHDDERLHVSLTGDEAQLCHRAAAVPIGIGGDRFSAGRELLDATDLRMLFLDDGFQHLQLSRDFDLVLVDALRPFGGGHLIPLGRLREPLEGLARASAFLITRAGEAANVKAVESVLRRYNARAPLFHAQMTAGAWHSADGISREEAPPAGIPAIAFCGLGNPNAFWRTLRQLGIAPLATYEYGDHHQYAPLEIRRLARHARDLGAEALLTTAKDVINLNPHFREIIAPLKLYWIEVRMEIERCEELFGLIRSSLKS